MFYNILTLVVGILYIVVGIFVIITKSFAVKLEPMAANALGALLCIYGLFRLYRAIVKIRRKNDEE